jgi:hypothetical protein
MLAKFSLRAGPRVTRAVPKDLASDLKEKNIYMIVRMSFFLKNIFSKRINSILKNSLWHTKGRWRETTPDNKKGLTE